MEENIKKCEKLLGKDRWVLGTEDKQAIKNLIKGYRKLQAKIDVSNWHEKSCREIINSKYIPKAKAKEKIQELMTIIKQIHEENPEEDTSQYRYVIEILQEFMEGK